MSVTTPELLAELDGCLADSLRRAANRAEHMRLTRIQGLVGELKQQLGSSAVSSVTMDPVAELCPQTDDR
jgi:hypothetical protein